MILTNRLFKRQAPSREAKSIYIFCEGVKREYQYFEYFQEMDSRINIEIYKLNPRENNSPKGLLEIAKKSIIAIQDHPNPKYDFQKNDEVWIVLDVDKDKRDSRKIQIAEVIEFCDKQENWELVRSNPCFEVWLYYHQFDSLLKFDGDEKCSNWKRHVNDSFTGGFDSRRHPVYIKTATENARKEHQTDDDQIVRGCTELFKLGESMLSILKDKIEKILKIVEENNK